MHRLITERIWPSSTTKLTPSIAFTAPNATPIGGDGVWGHADEHVGGGDMAGLTAVWARVVNVTGTLNPATLPAKLTALYNAQLAKCDALDGIADGIISNPGKCRVDPAALACAKGVDAPSCLTQAEVTAVKTL